MNLERKKGRKMNLERKKGRKMNFSLKASGPQNEFGTKKRQQIITS